MIEDALAQHHLHEVSEMKQVTQPASASPFKLTSTVLFNNWTVSVVLSAIYVITIIIFIKPVYPENDNIAILEASRDGYLVEFVGVAFTVYLHLLHKYVSMHVPWYALTLYAAHIASISLFLITLSAIPGSRPIKILYAIVYLACYSYFVFCVDYNSSSIMVGANALLAFLILGKANRSRLQAILLGTVFSASFLLRTHGMLGVLVFTAPFIVLYWIKDFIKGRLLLVFLVPVLLCAGVDLLFKGPLASPGYKQYRPYVYLQGELHNYGNLRYADSAILAINQWTLNDLKLFSNWMYVDEHKYSREKLENLSNHINRKKEMNTPRSALDPKHIQYFMKIYAPLLMLIGGILFLAFYGLNRKNSLLASAFILYGVFGAGYLELYYQFPVRIGFPLLLMYSTFLFSSVLLLFDPRGAVAKNLLKKMSLTLFVCCILSAGYLQAKFASELYTMETQFGAIYERIYTTLNSKYKGSVVLLGPTGFDFTGIAVSSLDDLFDKFQTVGFGWPIFSELFYAQLNEIGLKHGHELFPAFVDRSNYYILANAKEKQCIVDYLRENDYPTVKAVPVEWFDGLSVFSKDSFSVLYKFVSK